VLHLSDPNEAIGKTDHDFFADEHAMSARMDELEIIGSGIAMIDKEEREDWPDGRITWASTSKMPLFDGAGRCIGTFGVSRDITAQRRVQDSLLESEARFRDLTNSVREAFWIVDVRTNRTLYVSPAFGDIWGRSREHFYADASAWISTICDEDRDRVKASFEAKIEQQLELTFRIVRTNGEFRWIRSRVFPIIEDKEVKRVVCIAADITEHRRTAESSAKTQRLLASIVNSSHDAIVSQSIDGTVTSWNPAAARMFGYSAEEAMGETENVLLPSDQAAETISMRERILKGQNIQDFKTERRHKDGSMVAVSITASPIRDESGAIIGVSTHAHNISDRKRLEDKLSAVSEQLRVVLETTNEFVIAVDRDWQITYRNRLWDGGDPSTVVGQNLWEQASYLLGTSFETESRKAMDAHMPSRFEAYIAPLKIWLSGVAYPTGAGLLILSRDETEKYDLDNQLRSAQKMEAIGQLAAGISHEINTPIQYVGDNVSFMKDSWGKVAKVLAAAQKLRDEAEQGLVSPAAIADFDAQSREAEVEYLAEEMPHAIDQALDGVHRVAKIVGAMKQFSHPGSREKQLVDLNKALETTVTVSRNEWKYVAEMRTRFDPNLPFVPCLAGEINQVFLNLIVNAAHAIGDTARHNPGKTGTITIATRQDGDDVEVGITDTGTGIPEHIRDRVFDPFFTTKEVGKGTGQGLMLAHTLVVKKHGGRIWFESETGKGTTFFVRLPLSARGEV
jgi:PAS domain S-box-containing protein